MNHHQIARIIQIEHSSPVYTAITRKAYEGNSKAAAIKAKCLDCCCWQRVEISNCTAFACPLHPYRPYQNNQDEDAPESNP